MVVAAPPVVAAAGQFGAGTGMTFARNISNATVRRIPTKSPTKADGI
jgi:hypothetical protein